MCFEEAKRLSLKHTVCVFTLNYGAGENVVEKRPFEVRHITPIFQLGDGGLITRLSRELADFDVVHLHYPFYGAIGSLITAKKLVGFPLVATYHMDPQGIGFKKFLQAVYDSVYARRFFNLADQVIAVDRDYLSHSKYGQYINKEKLSIIANGVDLEIFCQRSTNWAELSLPELAQKKTILFVGNFLPVKNLDFLIKILPRLGSDTVLVIVGGGYDEKYIKELIAGTPYQKNIVFLGPLVDELKLSLLYAAADLVAIPSRSESFSLVAAEAMASGGIVLGSDTPGVSGRIDNGVDGFLAETENERAWVEKTNMIFSLSDDERRKISLNARRKAETCSWESHLVSLERVYNKIA